MIYERACRVIGLAGLASLGLFSSLALNGCSTQSTRSSNCETNFTTKGSFLTGKQFSTSEIIHDVSKKYAYAELYKILASDGYYIQSSSEHLGVISAYQNVNLSDKKAPLNALVKASAEDVEVSLTFVASAGVFTPESGARAEFCRIIHRINKK